MQKGQSESKQKIRKQETGKGNHWQIFAWLFWVDLDRTSVLKDRNETSGKQIPIQESRLNCRRLQAFITFTWTPDLWHENMIRQRRHAENTIAHPLKQAASTNSGWIPLFITWTPSVCACDTYWVTSMCCPRVQERMHPPFAAPQCLSEKRSVCSISYEPRVFILCRHTVSLSWDSPELFPDSHRRWWCLFTEWLKDALNIICFLSNWDPPCSYLCLLFNCLCAPHHWQQKTRRDGNSALSINDSAPDGHFIVQNVKGYFYNSSANYPQIQCRFSSDVFHLPGRLVFSTCNCWTSWQDGPYNCILGCIKRIETSRAREMIFLILLLYSWDPTCIQA